MLYQTRREGITVATEFKDRLAQVISESGCNKTKFAERLNISQAFLSQMCSGIRSPSDRTISDICKEFSVNEVWIRTGEGEPFQEETRQEQIMRFATQTVKGSDEFRKAFVSMLAKMDADDWETLAKLFDKLADEIKKSE